MDENFTITLPAAAWKMVKDCLGAPGWANSNLLIVIGGTMEKEKKIKLPDFLKPPITPEADKAWNETPVTFDFDLNQIQAIKKAVQFFVGQGAFPANQYSMLVIEKFGE